MRTSIKFRGKEVQNPIIRMILTFLTIMFGYFALITGYFVPFLGFVMWILIVGLFLVSSPITIPLHLALRALGRRGFIEMKNGEVIIEISGKGFQKK